MFYQVESFNDDISQWNVSKGVEFVSVTKLTRYDHDYYDIDNISHQNFALLNATDCWHRIIDLKGEMFYEAKSFNQDISQWNVSNAENIVSVTKIR